MSMPKLRFKEFDGDWLQTTLLDISELITKGTTPKVFKVGIINFLKIEAIQGNSFDLNKCQTIDTQVHEKELKRSILQEGDVLFAIAGATIGKNAIVTKDILPANTNQALAIIRLKNMNSKLFISKILNSPIMEKYIDENISVGAQPNLNLQQIGTFSFFKPELEEQTKIASFLSKVDEKISLLTKKNELLCQYKQGMMQKLFSQQIRFKADDGSDFGEWSETTLGQTGKFIGGGTPSKENNEFWEGSIPWISSSDLTEESIFKINITRYISSDGLNQSATKLVPANSILIVSRVGVGKVAITPHEICTSQDFTNLALTDGNSIFFAYLIKSLTPYLLEMNQGTSIKGFVKEDLSNLEILVPCLEEQTKIANFLSSIDQKIEVVVHQIEQAKTWKKGLLQQMFV
ncbi:restriction endonuclease subunit S [Acinetobacter guillouiae]|uniref:restriction endonuclease subunit S n=1 Tax=Acinetobacter guillouiae TaxID=106649 RepID=UPI0032B5F49E